MAPSPVLESFATLACVVLALAVTLRHERSNASGTVLALLLALAVWNGGLGIAGVALPGPWRATALGAATLGMFAAVGLWHLLALRHRWPRRLGGVGSAAFALAPCTAFFLGAATNAYHGWAILPDATWDPGFVGWAGPLSYVLAGWAFAQGLIGTGLFALAGVRMVRRGERRAGAALTATMFAMPLVSLNAGGGDPQAILLVSAGSLTLSTLVLALTSLRYQLLEPPPLGHREVIDHLRHGVLMANAAGEILDHNPAAQRILGCAPRGGSISDVVAGIASEADRETARRALAALEHAGPAIAFPLEAIGGRQIEVSARSIAGNHDASLGQVAILRDRTEEHRFAEAAMRTQKLESLGTLCAGIAHEVNNPLAFVRANLGEIARLGEIVERRLGGDDSKLADLLRETGELARDALDGLERIQGAVSDVRRLAAAPGGVDEVVSLDRVVGDAVRLAQRRAGDGVQIETRLAGDLPALRGSEQLLVQALLSLLLAAQHALEGTPEPRIEIASGADGDGVWVRLEDNGRAGGSPAPGESERDASGSSLGVSVAAGIVTDHGGSLHVETGERGDVYLLRLAASAEG